MVELKTYTYQETFKGNFIEVSDSEYEFLLSLVKVSNQQDALSKVSYIVDGREALYVDINNVYLPPIVRKRG